MLPSISVVIPCFNSEKWIGLAIDSIFSQNYPEIEIIIVNDGSTDDTATILKRYSDKVRVIEQKNCGVSVSRKTGCENASGTYVKFLDADDILPPGSLLKLANVAMRYPKDIIVGKTNVVDEVGNFISNSGYNLPVFPTSESLLQREYLLTQATHSGLWLIPRAVLNEAPFFDSTIKLGEEYIFATQIISTGQQVRFVDEVVYSVRDHSTEGRLSRIGTESDYLLMLNLIINSTQLIKEYIRNYDQKAIRIIARLCWSRGRHCLRCGYSSAAIAYFTFASSLDRQSVPDGKLIYRVLCGLLGPLWAEKAIGHLKRIFVPRQ